VAANERIAVASDPGHEIAHPLPHVISREYQQEMEGELRIELTDVGYTVRQAAEVVHAFRAYAALTREWNRQRQRALEVEANGEGFRAKAYELLLASRRMGAKVRDPKVLDRAAIERMRAAAAHKHDKVTKKIVGNWVVMAVAVLLKAFLLVPLANKFLLTVLPDADAVRGLASIALAAVLAYTLTFVARYLVQVGVGMHAPEDAPKRRSVADIMHTRANRTMFRIVFGLFVVVLGMFLAFDFMNAGGEWVGAVGLSVLFIAILLVFEMFLAYRLAVMQDEQPESMEAVDERYLAALNRADDETDLAKLRTLALDAEKSWNRFLTALDSGVLARKPRHRRRALAALRDTMGMVESAQDALHDGASREMDALERASLNGKAVVAAPEGVVR
jgi:hypothetical protein